MTRSVNYSFDERGRCPYDVLKNLFNDAYAYCQQVGKLVRDGKVARMEDRSEYAFAYDQANLSIEFAAIESLMLEVISLTVDAGRGSARSLDFHQQKIKEILNDNDLHQLLDTLPSDEREDFERLESPTFTVARLILSALSDE